MGIRITGVGAYVPDQRVTNDDLARRVDTSQEWISAKTGILERRISAPDEAPSDMGVQAALRCLANAGVDKSAVDLIIVACASPDQCSRRSLASCKRSSASPPVSARRSM